MKNKQKAPFFSVVVPTYNSGGYIAGTLESIFKQSYRNYEVVVSDDGSEDNTSVIVKSLFEKYPNIKTKLILNEHEGPGVARNKGIVASEGEWVAFLDSDDLWFPEKLQKVATFILENEEADLVCHSLIWEKGDKHVTVESYKYLNGNVPPFLSVYRKPGFLTSTVTVRKELLYEVGLFDETLLSAQDYDLFIRLSRVAQIRCMKETLGIHVQTPNSVSSRIFVRLDCLLRIAEKYRQDLEGVARFPGVEVRRRKGRAFCSCGLKLMHSGEIKTGLFFIIKGLCIWPFYGVDGIKSSYRLLKGFIC